MPSFEGDPKSYPLADLNANGMTGSCLCKSITVTITAKDLFTKPNGHICHCLNCRRITGSSAWNLILLPTEHLHIDDPKGYMKSYMDGDTATGRPLPRTFCSNCGSTLGNIAPEGERPSYTPVALGLFPRIPEPEFELFSAHRQEWLKPAVCEDRCHQFREGAEDEF